MSQRFKTNKKPPLVRQTLTSKYRMLKANPLLVHELERKLTNKEEFVVTPLKTLAEILDQRDNPMRSTTYIKTFPNPSKIDQKNMEREYTKKPSNSSSALLGIKSIKKNTPSKALKGKSNVNIECVTLDQTKTFKVGESFLSNSKPNNLCNELHINRRKSCTPSNSKEITRRLSEWLRHKGKNVGDFHHLKCFGVNLHSISKKVNHEEKENVATTYLDDNNKSSATPNDKKNDVDVSTVAKEALTDLHKLILEGYPVDQCEIWLKLVKEKFTELEDEPQYWECRAALEQSKGNINLAVECYKTALIQGAEVQNVDQHLDLLLQKFCLLEISGEIDSREKNVRNKIVEDARNIFKSSIIQFAVQERIFKTKSAEGVSVEKKMIATPVRRSTRLSRCAFTSTPGIRIYSSLREMDTSLRESLNFQPNDALRD